MQKAIYLFLVLSILSCGNDHSKIILDIKDLKGNTSRSIENKLGLPDSTYQRKIFGVQYYIVEYKKNKTEIRFYQDTVTQIILNEPSSIEFTPASLTKFGFKDHPPKEMDENAMIRWQNVEGIKDINFYLVGKKNKNMPHGYFKIYFNMEK